MAPVNVLKHAEQKPQAFCISSALCRWVHPRHSQREILATPSLPQMPLYKPTHHQQAVRCSDPAGDEWCAARHTAACGAGLQAGRGHWCSLQHYSCTARLLLSSTLAQIGLSQKSEQLHAMMPMSTTLPQLISDFVCAELNLTWLCYSTVKPQLGVHPEAQIMSVSNNEREWIEHRLRNEVLCPDSLTQT